MFVEPVYFENEDPVLASCCFLSMSHVSPLQGLSQEQLKDYTQFKLVLTKEEEDSSDNSDDDDNDENDDDDDGDDDDDDDDDNDGDDDGDNSSADSKDGPSDKQQVSEVV